MAEYALRVRFEEPVLLVAETFYTPRTWNNREEAVQFALDNGISHKVYPMGMWYEEDWYSKTVTLENLQDEDEETAGN